MRQRCGNINHPDWKYYGAQGVKVCDRWQCFWAFVDDVGERPEGCSIDRWPNKHGDYGPDNFRWATDMEQAQNKRMYKNNVSGVRGVEPRSGKWVARLRHKGVLHHLGTFEDKTEAIAARKNAEKEIRGC